MYNKTIPYTKHNNSDIYIHTNDEYTDIEDEVYTDELLNDTQPDTEVVYQRVHRLC